MSLDREVELLRRKYRADWLAMKRRAERAEMMLSEFKDATCKDIVLMLRAERAEAELEAFRDSGLSEMWTQDRARAERAEAALARVRLLIEGNGYFRLNHYTITAGELRAALEGDPQ